MSKLNKYGTIISIANITFSSFMATISFVLGNFAIAFIFVAFCATSTISLVTIKSDKFDSVVWPNALLIFTTFSAAAYVYFPEGLTAFASIVGVASFIYLLVEKVISDSFRQ